MNCPKLPNPMIAIFNGFTASTGISFNGFPLVAGALADDIAARRPIWPRETLGNETIGLVVLRVKSTRDLGVELDFKGEALRVIEAIFCVPLPLCWLNWFLWADSKERGEGAYI